MFVSAPALLPSSSSMTLFMLVMAMWLKGQFGLAVRSKVARGSLPLRVFPAGISPLISADVFEQWTVYILERPRWVYVFSPPFKHPPSTRLLYSGESKCVAFELSAHKPFLVCPYDVGGCFDLPSPAALLQQILVAMVCVFGTGWPFVGVIFIPMLLNCAWLRLRRGTSFAEGLGAATASATWALICAGAVAGLATWVDSGWYGRSTSPTYNIL